MISGRSLGRPSALTPPLVEHLSKVWHRPRRPLAGVLPAASSGRSRRDFGPGGGGVPLSAEGVVAVALVRKLWRPSSSSVCVVVRTYHTYCGATRRFHEYFTRIQQGLSSTASSLDTRRSRYSIPLSSLFLNEVTQVYYVFTSKYHFPPATTIQHSRANEANRIRLLQAARPLPRSSSVIPPRPHPRRFRLLPMSPPARNRGGT